MSNPSPILGNRSRPLINGLKQAGVDLGSDVKSAQASQQEAMSFLFPYASAVQAAEAALRGATGADFRKKSAALVKANAELAAAQASNATVQALAEQTLLDTIGSQIHSYDQQLVSAFNGVVEQYRLVELSSSLPKWGVDGIELSMLTLNGRQAEAVLSWRSASEHLHPIWTGYTRLATFRGYTVGPAGLDGLHQNRLTATCLGAMTAADTMSAASVLTALSENVEATRELRPILPFACAPIAGFELRLRSVTEADSLLGRMRRVGAPGAIPVGVS